MPTAPRWTRAAPKLREEVAAARTANAARPDTHDYDEAATRDRFIDLLLREAGWNPDAPGTTEVEVSGMPGATGKGFVDYVLWGDDGKPLALVEAKRSRASAMKGQQQAKLYADCLEAMHGQRPVIFGSNGYEHWIWDDTHVPPRAVQGFYKKAELALLIQRRTRRPLADATPDGRIVERHYQQRAIRRVAETFEMQRQRKALVVMATGAGKTRTVIALAELLMRANWAKRVLFLADRVALVNQAVNAFKAHLPAAAPVNLVTDKAQRGPGVRFDLPHHDGADRGGRTATAPPVRGRALRPDHRGRGAPVRSTANTGAIFDWFDSLLVGLTATPKDEIDRNTYGLFELESGVPTDAYTLEEAVADGYLVPMRAISVPLKFQREGITPTTRCRKTRRTSGTRWTGSEDGRHTGPGGRPGGQQMAVQRRHRGQGAGPPDEVTASTWKAATVWARPSCSPRTTPMPSSSRGASMPTTRT